MNRLAAIMVNWNGGGLAVHSARSIAEQSHPSDLWIVDNNSVDGSLDGILAACPTANATRNKSNTGFAHANNQVLRQLGSHVHYVLLINNDVILPDRDCLMHLIRFLDSAPTVQGLCGRYEYPDGRFQHFYNQLPDHIVLMTNWGVLRHLPGALTSKRMRRFVLADGDFSRPMTIEQPAFSCVLMRASAMRTIGGFDEQFPIFFNDIDFCWRWRESGWTWHYRPEWRIIHHKSTSTSRLGALIQAEMASSATRFARKHLSPTRYAAVRCAIMLELLYRRIVHRERSVPIV